MNQPGDACDFYGVIVSVVIFITLNESSPVLLHSSWMCRYPSPSICTPRIRPSKIHFLFSAIARRRLSTATSGIWNASNTLPLPLPTKFMYRFLIPRLAETNVLNSVTETFFRCLTLPVRRNSTYAVLSTVNRKVNR